MYLIQVFNSYYIVIYLIYSLSFYLSVLYVSLWFGY